MKDVLANYETLVNLLERIQFFLQRLNHYTAVPLTSEMNSLLGKIMAQVLSVLALSTKAMKERRISGSLHSMPFFMADLGTETFMKRLVGKKDLEDALERLDMLTREENLMTAARILEVTHHMDANLKATKELTHNVHDDVKVTNHGAQHSFDLFVHITDPRASYHVETAMNDLQRSLLLDAPFTDRSWLKHAHREPVTREASNMALSPKSFY